MCSMSFVYMLGTFLCRWLLVRFGVARSVAMGGVLSLAGGILLNLSAWMQWHSVFALVGPFMYLFWATAFTNLVGIVVQWVHSHKPLVLHLH